MPRDKVLLAVLFLGCCPSLFSDAKSSNVVIIGAASLGCVGGANEIINSGCLPVTGPPGELGDFHFAALAVNNVSAASLAPYDTVVLNIASVNVNCNPNNISVAAKGALVAWAGQGHKLIIYDSECTGPGANGALDYSWLPFPFSTANPGQTGSTGVLTIVENSTLASSDRTDPNYVDADDLGRNTDAVGDSNVMVSKDAHWCVNMIARNSLGFSGPVHTYAKYPALTDTGLIIYSGFDQDFQDPSFSNPNLRKLWVNQLQQPFNPSFLPCGVSVAGITLTPAVATNPPGSSHTVTATLRDQSAAPQVNVNIGFAVTQGPNQNAAGTCSPATCRTDANGQVTFTYNDPPGVTGTDTIQACFTPSGSTPVCITATKLWAITACAPHAVVTLTAQPAFGDAGQAAEVAVALSQSPQPPCSGLFQFDTRFDSSKLTFSSARKGEALTAASKDIVVQPSSGVVTISSSGPNQNTIGNGNVAYLTFNLKSGFTTGTTPLVMGRCLASDINAVPLTTSCVSGSVTAACGCDVNADGVINILDAQLLVNQVMGKAPATCDLNRDGAINAIDVQRDVNAVLGLGCR